jgi:aryl-alcohol dehydrogenase-like predicted oxidoreductase
MLRRAFLQRSSRFAAGAFIASYSLGCGRSLAIPPLTEKFSASDSVTLGQTGITTSRLAMGTGTVGAGKHSHQTALGIDGLSRLLLNGFHENGLRFFDAADSYGSHPHVAEALKHLDRSKITILTKSWARDPDEMRSDLDRFRRELGTEQLDIVLMHCLTDGDWTTRFRPVMDVLEEAKQKKIIRAHGCSCHSIEALRAAAKSPWVQVDLARVNPVGAHMDSDPDTVLGVLREMKASGKAVLGMKILGQGALRDRQDDALRYALGLNVLDAFTIGAESIAEQNDLARRIAAAA